MSSLFVGSVLVGLSAFGLLGGMRTFRAWAASRFQSTPWPPILFVGGVAAFCFGVWCVGNARCEVLGNESHRPWAGFLDHLVTDPSDVSIPAGDVQCFGLRKAPFWRLSIARPDSEEALLEYGVAWLETPMVLPPAGGASLSTLDGDDVPSLLEGLRESERTFAEVLRNEGVQVVPVHAGTEVREEGFARAGTPVLLMAWRSRGAAEDSSIPAEVRFSAFEVSILPYAFGFCAIALGIGALLGAASWRRPAEPRRTRTYHERVEEGRQTAVVKKEDRTNSLPDGRVAHDVLEDSMVTRRGLLSRVVGRRERKRKAQDYEEGLDLASRITKKETELVRIQHEQSQLHKELHDKEADRESERESRKRQQRREDRDFEHESVTQGFDRERTEIQISNERLSLDERKAALERQKRERPAKRRKSEKVLRDQLRKQQEKERPQFLAQGGSQEDWDRKCQREWNTLEAQLRQRKI